MCSVCGPCQIFRPHWFRFAIIIAIALTTIGTIGWRAPMALWFVVPFFVLVLVLAAFLNAGLILSAEGIEWYAVHPNLRIRKIPWHAVISVRKSLFGLGRQFVVIAEAGPYEAWIWGTPRQDQQFHITIWPDTLSRGEEVWDAIQTWLSPRNPGDTGIMAVDRNTAPPGAVD